jgi:hypothetical protein
MNLIQELMNQAHTGGLLQTEHIKRFSPAEIREAIQTLVATSTFSFLAASSLKSSTSPVRKRPAKSAKNFDLFSSRYL